MLIRCSNSHPSFKGPHLLLMKLFYDHSVATSNYAHSSPTVFRSHFPKDSDKASFGREGGG